MSGCSAVEHVLPEICVFLAVSILIYNALIINILIYITIELLIC